MLPEMSLSQLPLHVWTGIKAISVIAGLFLLAAPNPQAGFDRNEMARLTAKKVIDWDPVVTGSVPVRPTKKPVKA